MKVVVRRNYRVLVFPATDSIEACKRIAEQIKRLCDDLRPYCSTDIISDVDARCKSCGAPWTGNGDTYNNGCCGPDERGET